MRKLLTIALLALPLLVAAQFPDTPRKIRLGYQTNANYLVYVRAGAPDHTPADANDTYLCLDTLNDILYFYDVSAMAWDTITGSGGGGGIDSQTLSFASPNLTISGGNTVSLAPLISGLLSGVDSSIFASVYRVDTASAAIRSEIPTNNNQLTNGAGYITGNQPITLSGDVTGSGTTAITTDIANGAVDWAELSTAVQDSIQAGDSRVDTLPTASGIPTHLALFLAERQLGSLNGLRINDTAKMVLLPATWGILAPGGTTAQRWTGAAGALYYNQDVGQYQFHNGTTWNSMSPFTILPSGDLYYNGGNLGINLTSPSFLLDISSTATSSNNLFRLQGVQAGATFSVTATGDELFYNFPVKNRFTFAASTGYIRMDNGGFRWQPAVKVQTINGREVFNVNEYAWGGGGPRYSGIEISNDAYETLTLSGIATSKGRQYATPFLLNLPAGETSGTLSNLAGDYIAAMAIKSDIMGYQGAPTLNLAGILLNPEFLSTDPKGRADTVDNVYGYFYEPIALPSYHSNHYSFYGSSGRMKVANYEFDNEESLTGHDGDALRYNASTGRIALSAASYGSLKKTTATPLYFGPTDTLVTGMTSGVSLNTTLTDSTITVGVAGVYEITYTGTVSLDPTAGGTYLVTFSLYNNSTELGETLSEYEIVASASSNWFGNISGHTVMSLAESDVISLRYSGNTEVPSELRNVSLSVKKL